MRVYFLVFSALLALAGRPATIAAAAAPDELGQLVAEFERYSGARLVFRKADLPPGEYFQILPELTRAERLNAARIACREVQKYPPRYLGDVKLRAVGIFQACADPNNDGFHPFDKELGGYRYFGLYNQRDAFVAAYYTDSQLPLTLHHELFHHIDRVTPAVGDWAEMLATPTAAPFSLLPRDRAELARAGSGQVLADAVSPYAAKNPAEDKSETARHFQSTLADSLLQMAGRPQLAGSRRLNYILATYARSNSGQGPGADWFVNLARSADRFSALPAEKLDAQALLMLLRLRRLACDQPLTPVSVGEATEALSAAEALIPRLVEPVLVEQLVRAYAGAAIPAAPRRHSTGRAVPSARPGGRSGSKSRAPRRRGRVRPRGRRARPGSAAG